MIVPGAVILSGFLLISPSLVGWLENQGVSIGTLGIFVILAYAAGHLVQAVGNLLEQCVWWVTGGRPTNWPQSGRKCILTDSQCARLLVGIRKRGWVKVDSLSDVAPCEWAGVVSEITHAIRASRTTARLDAFNRTYGMLRGLAAALLVVLVCALVSSRGSIATYWRIDVALCLLITLALVRMQRFSRHYATEVFTQFLSDCPTDIESSALVIEPSQEVSDSV